MKQKKMTSKFLNYNTKLFKLKLFNKVNCFLCNQNKPNCRYFRERGYIGIRGKPKHNTICQDCLPKRTAVLIDMNRLTQIGEGCDKSKTEVKKINPICSCDIKDGLLISRCINCILGK